MGSVEPLPTGRSLVSDGCDGEERREGRHGAFSAGGLFAECEQRLSAGRSKEEAELRLAQLVDECVHHLADERRADLLRRVAGTVRNAQIHWWTAWVDGFHQEHERVWGWSAGIMEGIGDDRIMLATVACHALTRLWKLGHTQTVQNISAWLSDCVVRGTPGTEPPGD